MVIVKKKKEMEVAKRLIFRFISIFLSHLIRIKNFFF